jgi:glycosyltransferase involved in cell wall biosynthesis
MKRLTVSVALATYNGERFLTEQLDSIVRQSEMPDEVVVGDDGSTDGTREILLSFSRRAGCPVRIETNAQRLGASANFAAVLTRCRGDLVLLSDQDDIWARSRVQRSIEVLERHPDAAFAFSNATLVDGEGQRLAGTLWESFFFGPREQQLFGSRRGHEVLLQRNVVTGATMAIRRARLAAALPIPHGWAHDGWFALLLEPQYGAVPVDEPWITYRLHPAQQTGVIRLSVPALLHTLRCRDAGFYRAECRNYRVLTERLRRLGPDYAHVARSANEKAAFLGLRAEGLERLADYLRCVRFARRYRSYARHGLGTKQALFDLVGVVRAALSRGLSRSRSEARSAPGNGGHDQLARIRRGVRTRQSEPPVRTHEPVAR